MKVWAISDLHLSFLEEYHYGEPVKEHHSMDIFGEKWHKHYEKIYYNWENTIGENDVVLMPGDISWSMTLDEGKYDWAYLKKLKGKIIMSKGNHDYWWQSYTKVKESLPENIVPLQNNCVKIGSKVICAIRGWDCPSENFTKDDEKIYKRELIRLELGLKEAVKLGGEIIVMFHYPPVNNNYESTGFVELMLKYGVKQCIYGHIHNTDKEIKINEKFGIKSNLVSCDFLDFMPKLMWEEEQVVFTD